MIARDAKALDLHFPDDDHTDQYPQFTDDELNVEQLRISLAIERRRQTFSFYCPVSILSENQSRIDAVVGDIISTADAQARPNYQSELKYLREQWVKRGNKSPYVPSVTGGSFGEIQDWDAPDVMRRRAKLRASPLVQEILSTHRLH
jgi:hypothetical protein